MILTIINLMVSMTYAQSRSIPANDPSQPNWQQGLQQNLDDKFGVKGGTISGQVNVSSGVNINGGAYCFPDRSCQTSAVLLTGDNAWTGTNTFSRSVTINGLLTATSTPSISGIYVLDQIIDPSGATYSTFTLTLGRRYKMEWDLYNGTDWNPQIQFNGDAGANYRWVFRLANDNATVVDERTSGANGTFCAVTRQSAALPVKANFLSLGRNFYINSGIDSNFRATVSMDHEYWGNDATVTSYNYVKGGCGYTGASAIANVALYPSAGTVTGQIRLFRYIP